MIRLRIVLLLLLPFCPHFASAQATMNLSVSPNSNVPSGTPATINISVVDSGTGQPVVSDIGSCQITDSSANQIETDNFGTDSNGNGSVTTAGTLDPGTYSAICSTVGFGTPAESASQAINFTIVAGACVARNASTEDSSSQPPSFIIFDLTVALTPSPPYPVPVTQEPGQGVTGINTGFYDCAANPRTTSSQRPELEALGYTTRINGGIDYSWTIHNYNYNPGPACTSGYCNGVSSLGVTESAPLNVTLTFYCS